MEARRELILAKLNQRHKKPSTNGTSTDRPDDVKNSTSGNIGNDFQRHFSEECSDILEEIETVQNDTKRQPQDKAETKFADLADKITKFQSRLNESSSSMAAYERRKATTNLQELQDKLKQVRLESQPQRRFAFTNVKPVEQRTGPRISQNSANGASDIPDCATSAAASVVIQGRRNDESITIYGADCQGKDILLVDCQSCTIRVLGVTTTTHAKNLVDCTIISFPVATSIFIQNCQRSTFVVACQQLRMHSSVDCDVYLHVTTRAIIEDCQRIAFAPYLEALEGEKVEESFEKASLNRFENNWDKVQDFNWLITDRPSPSWSVLPYNKRHRFDMVA